MRELEKLFLMLVIPSALSAMGCGSAPLGFGEGMDSPDGKFTADVFKFPRERTFGRDTYLIKITLTRKSDEKIVWSDEISYEDDSRAPDYYDRSKQFIKWSQDSSSFTVDVLDGKVRTVKVPDNT